MAQLKDTIVSGNLRVTDTTLTDTLQVTTIKAPTSSGGTTYGSGTSGQVLKSNGTTTYWGDDNNSSTVLQSATTTSNFRPLVFGTKDTTTISSLADTVTGQLYTSTRLFFQPSSGNLYMYSPSGDSPALIFQRGTFIDSSLDWKMYDTGGALRFAQAGRNTSTESWVTVVEHKTSTNAASTPAIRSMLGVYGTTYGNTAANMLGGTAGVFQYGDGGPQIDFSTSPGNPQSGALIFTDNDTAATGVSWHFVSTESDWNVTSKRFHAKSSISIGTDTPNTSYNLYVYGTTNITGNTTIGGTLGVTGAITQNGNQVLHAGNYTSYTYSSTASRTANYVLAAPNGSAGAATFRKLVAADLPSHTHAYTVPPSVFAVQTGSTKQSHITLETLMTWLISTKAYITLGANRSLTLCTTWSYSDNDILQLSINGTNYELQLAGVIIEFDGAATSYNAGVFRLRIHSSPTLSFTPASGYTQFPASHIAEYTCNGSGYSPTWKMIIDRADISNGTSTTGNGTISVAGKAVSVYGLGSAAYTASTAYLPSTTKYAASASVAGPASLLAYGHTNEINISGGKQSTCYFNYRDADTDAQDEGETPVSINYKFCNYRNSTANTTITAANFAGNASTATKWQTARTLTIGSTGKSVDGSGNVSWSLSEIGAAPAVSGGYLPLAGGTMTGPLTMKANQYSGTYGLDMNNSDIVGANRIVFADLADSYTEGLAFYRTTTDNVKIYDNFWIKEGVMYFTPNAPTATTNNVVLHTGNLSTYVKASSNNGKISVNGSDVTVYTHPTKTPQSTSDFYKITVDDTGHVTTGDALTAANLPAHTHAYAGSATAGGIANQAHYLVNERLVSTSMTYGSEKLEWYDLSGNDGSDPTKKQNPQNDWFHHITMHHKNNAGYYFDMAYSFNSNAIFYRRVQNGADKGWVRLIDSSNIGSQTVSSAATLSTPRNISLGTGVTSTATAFDGSADITIPVTGIKEAYLTWGGKDFTQSFSPFDAALEPRLGANRLEMCAGTGIKIERTTDSGTSWTEVTTSSINNANRSTLFSSSAGYSVPVSATSTASMGTDAAKYMMRITLDTSVANVYTVLNKFILNISTQGAANCYVKLRIRTAANVTAGSDTWLTWDKTNKTWSSSPAEADTRCPIGGWSGFNVINTAGITTYGNNTSQYRNIQFIFGCTKNDSTSAGLVVINIQGYGGVAWNAPSNMARTGHLYSWTGTGAATFPSSVTANGNLIASSASGDSPALIFKRGGSYVDNLNDWKIYVSSGHLYFDQSTANASSETWTHKMYYHTSNSNLYIGSSPVLHSGNTSFTQTLSSGTKIGSITIAGTATDIYAPTNTDEKVKVDLFTSTTSTDYMIAGATAAMATTAAHLVIDTADGVASARMRLQKGTTSAVGQAMLMLGNNIGAGTAKNMQGSILMYASTTYYGKISMAALTDNRTWTMPDKTGTVALTSDIPTFSVTSSGTGPVVTGMSYSSGVLTYTKGRVLSTSGGQWIAGRDNAPILANSSSSTANGFYPLAAVKTNTGAWAIGALGNGDSLAFSFSTDTNYSGGTNATNNYYIGTDGAFTGTAAGLTTKAVTASTINTTPGSFVFGGTNLIGGVNDWVGFQADAGNDRFQIIANSQLVFRQNDTTTIESWDPWIGCLTPNNVSGDSGITITNISTTIGTGTTALTYNSGVKISHTNSITASTSEVFKKFSYDANGHITGTANVAASDIPALNYIPNTESGLDAAINLLSVGSSNPNLADYYISQYASGGTTSTTYHRRPISALWNTFKGLITLETTGTGNAVTDVSIANDGANNRKITVTKGSTFFCEEKLTPSTTTKTRNILHIYGSTVGNTASELVGGVKGVLSYGDAGPQINFSTVATIGSAQDSAIIWTDNDSAATGVSWHFVSNQSDWNVISKRFHARTGISIGTDLPNTTYNLYVNGTTYHSDAITFGSTTTQVSSALNIYTRSFSTYNTLIKWSNGSTWGTRGAEIGYHNTGGDSTNPGTICILPYQTESNPWDGQVGLFIKKDHVYIDGAELSKTDANVLQTSIGSTYTNYRPLLIGASNSGTAGFTPTTTTDGTYATAGIYCQPSSGKIYASEFITNTYLSASGSSLATNGLYLKSYFKCADSSQTVLQYSGYGLRTYSGKIATADGLLVAVGCGGLTILGGGESANNLSALISDDQKISGKTTLNVGGTLNTSFTGNSEIAIISSDSSIYLITNCQTIANRKPVCLDASSNFYPGTNKTGSIGTSTYMWNTIYGATVQSEQLAVKSGTYTTTIEKGTTTADRTLVLPDASGGIGIANILLNDPTNSTSPVSVSGSLSDYDYFTIVISLNGANSDQSSSTIVPAIAGSHYFLFQVLESVGSGGSMLFPAGVVITTTSSSISFSVGVNRGINIPSSGTATSIATPRTAYIKMIIGHKS